MSALPRGPAAATEMGLDLTAHQSRPITGLPVEEFDLILTMERGQAEAIRSSSTLNWRRVS